MGPVVIAYDYPVAVTSSDTTDDPAGPFAGLLVSAAGNIVVYPLNGPSANFTIAVVAGQEVHFPVRRIGATGTTATVLGLKHGVAPASRSATI